MTDSRDKRDLVTRSVVGLLALFAIGSALLSALALLLLPYLFFLWLITKIGGCL